MEPLKPFQQLSTNVADALLAEKERMQILIKNQENKLQKVNRNLIMKDQQIQENNEIIKQLSDSTAIMRQRLALVLSGNFS